jgi:hypothetical protein
MKVVFWIVMLCLSFLPVPAAHAGLFGSSVDDLLTVKKLEGKQAILEGSSEGLKAGDSVYFARSPYHFTVTAVQGGQVTIALPEKNDLAVGNTLMRHENDQVKRAIDTERRLKQALEE